MAIYSREERAFMLHDAIGKYVRGVVERQHKLITVLEWAEFLMLLMISIMLYFCLENGFIRILDNTTAQVLILGVFSVSLTKNMQVKSSFVVNTANDLLCMNDKIKTEKMTNSDKLNCTVRIVRACERLLREDFSKLSGPFFFSLGMITGSESAEEKRKDIGYLSVFVYLLVTLFFMLIIALLFFITESLFGEVTDYVNVGVLNIVGGLALVLYWLTFIVVLLKNVKVVKRLANIVALFKENTANDEFYS